MTEKVTAFKVLSLSEAEYGKALSEITDEDLVCLMQKVFAEIEKRQKKRMHECNEAKVKMRRLAELVVKPKKPTKSWLVFWRK